MISFFVLVVTAALSLSTPIELFLLEEPLELALAASAAPAAIAEEATLLVLGREGYREARQGSNGFTCLVLRAWDGPGAESSEETFYDERQRAPICFNPAASRSILRVHLRRTELVARGESLETIRATISSELESGKLRFAEDSITLAYMFSSGQRICPEATKLFPHVMIYAPGMTNADAGGLGLGQFPFVLGGGSNEPPVFTIPVGAFVDPAP